MSIPTAFIRAIAVIFVVAGCSCALLDLAAKSRSRWALPIVTCLVVAFVAVVDRLLVGPGDDHLSPPSIHLALVFASPIAAGLTVYFLSRRGATRSVRIVVAVLVWVCVSIAGILYPVVA